MKTLQTLLDVLAEAAPLALTEPVVILILVYLILDRILDHIELRQGLEDRGT